MPKIIDETPMLAAPPPSNALGRVFALRVTPLLRELIFAAFELDASSERAELVVKLILHQLTETPDAPTFLPLPASTIARRVADLALADPRACSISTTLHATPPPRRERSAASFRPKQARHSDHGGGGRGS